MKARGHMAGSTDLSKGQLSSGQSAYRRLLDAIHSGDFPPGTRLLETELAARFGSSRTPVREAIRQLEADGLVTHLPRLGATIRSLSHAEVIELYEMRAVLEGTAARLAARSASDVELAELAALNNDLTATRAGVQAQELNRQFHRTLIDAAKNRFLIKSMSALQKTLLILGPSTLTDAARAQAAVTEHANVLAALQARDGATAEAHMRAHVEAALSTRIRTMRSREIRLEENT